MSAPRQAAIILAAALAAGFLGAFAGQPFGYALAALLGRGPAEIKASLIWGILLTPVVGAAGGAWIAAAAIRSRAARATKFVFIGSVALFAAVLVAAYDPVKTSGIPVFEYELAMPADIRIAGIGAIDLSLWNGKDAKGCAIARIAEQGARRLIVGSFALPPDNAAPVLSVAFHDGTRWTSGGRWSLHRANRTAIEPSFGAWETIAFGGTVHDLPLAQGPFSIRYRLRGFM